MPKEDVSEARRAQIYEAALRCFGRDGYERTTMDGIVAESGLSKGALYWYFKSKKELFTGLFAYIMRRLATDWQALISQPGLSAVAKLRASLDFFRTRVEPLAPVFEVMMQAWALTRHDDAVAGLAREAFAPLVATIQGILEQGVAEGAFHIASPADTAMAILTLVRGLVAPMGGAARWQDWDRVTAAAGDLVLYGLGVRQPDALH
jgi:AcrR family transcriptional regulator